MHGRPANRSVDPVDCRQTSTQTDNSYHTLYDFYVHVPRTVWYCHYFSLNQLCIMYYLEDTKSHSSMCAMFLQTNLLKRKSIESACSFDGTIHFIIFLCVLPLESLILARSKIPRQLDCPTLNFQATTFWSRRRSGKICLSLGKIHAGSALLLLPMEPG